MKNWLFQIFASILSIGENRYVHDAFGSLIATLVMCVTLWWMPAWLSITLAFVVATAAMLVKDCLLDAKADVWDILFGIFGALKVIIPAIILCCLL